jgi:hypothetical protein
VGRVIELETLGNPLAFYEIKNEFIALDDGRRDLARLRYCDVGGNDA